MPEILGTGAYRYETDDTWAKLPPGQEFNADVAAVGVDAQDRVYAFNRGRHPMPAKTTRPPTTSWIVNLGSRLRAGSWAGAGSSTMSASPVWSAIMRAPSSGTTLKITRSSGALSPQ